MAYITPITDRKLSDIRNQTAKGKFVVSDWARITNNLEMARELVEWAHSATVPQGGLVVPTTETMWKAEDFNALAENIIAVQQAAKLILIWFYRPKANFTNGPMGKSITYKDVNVWEKIIDIIVKKYSKVYKTRVPIVGTATLSEDMNRQNQWRT